MVGKQITCDDAEKAVDDGSYKDAPDTILREMYKVCLNAVGPNQNAVSRIRRKGEIIWEELSSREKKLNAQQKEIALCAPNTANENYQIQSLQEISSSAASGWDEAKVEGLIRDKIEESLTLEYKAAAALARDDKVKAEITKDVSAMANSAGGTLLYGLTESNSIPQRLDPINRVEFSREWLENIISQIRPRIPNLKIYPVQLKSDSNAVVYVVEIPQGATAHQANDFRYYRRYNFQSTPMLDHEVRDVMSRKSLPSVSVNLRFVKFPHQNNDGSVGSLVATIENKSDVLARYVALVIHSPIKIHNQILCYEESSWDNGEEGCAYRLLFSNHNEAPLFPRGNLRKVFKYRYGMLNKQVPQKQLGRFRWVVFADAMPMQSGAFNIEEIFEEMTM